MGAGLGADALQLSRAGVHGCLKPSQITPKLPNAGADGRSGRLSGGDGQASSGAGSERWGSICPCLSFITSDGRPDDLVGKGAAAEREHRTKGQKAKAFRSNLTRHDFLNPHPLYGRFPGEILRNSAVRRLGSRTRCLRNIQQNDWILGIVTDFLSRSHPSNA